MILLQPEDSRRVADALIEEIKIANFDLAGAIATALEYDGKHAYAKNLGTAIGFAAFAASDAIANRANRE